MLRTSLSWGHYAGLQPWTLVDEQLSAQEHTYVERTGQGEIYCDHIRWRFENHNQLLGIFFLLRLILICMIPSVCFSIFIWTVLFESNSIFILLGVVMAFGSMIDRVSKYFFYIPAIFTAILIVTHYEPSDHYFTWIIQPFLIGCASYYAGTLGIDGLTWLYLKLTDHDGSEFNRQDGMVRIARRFGRPPFVAPFYEFDAVLELRVAPNVGGSHYCVNLIHRYTNFSVFLGGKMYPLGMSQADAYAFWDTLQRYMDVTQPLPDLPVLEQFRHLDPVTAEYDRKTGRNPRYWRDMHPKAWSQRLSSALIQKNANYPWQQAPCILQARMDPNLSVADYYRAQEVRGMIATPRAHHFSTSQPVTQTSSEGSTTTQT